MVADMFIQLLNLVALGALVYYGYRKYGAPALQKYIFEQRLAREKLEHTYESLREQQRIIEHEIQYQEQQALELMVKLGRWRLVMEQEHAAQREHEQLSRERMQERVKQQEHYQQIQTLKQHVLPKAFEQAEHELRAEFSDSKKAQAYIANLINDLK